MSSGGRWERSEGMRDYIRTALGASNHCEHSRAEADYYSTDPRAVEWLLKIEPFLGDIWEPACGENAIVDVLRAAGKNVRASDVIVRCDGVEQLDFLSVSEAVHGVDIVTNPPFKFAKEFVERALALVDDGRYVCMFLRLTFLEGQARRKLFEDNPPIRVWVSSSRLVCYKDGVVKDYSSPCCYAWFVWKKGWHGPTDLGWFN